MLTLLASALGVLLVSLVVLRFGVDSRDGLDWRSKDAGCTDP